MGNLALFTIDRDLRGDHDWIARRMCVVNGGEIISENGPVYFVEVGNSWVTKGLAIANFIKVGRINIIQNIEMIIVFNEKIDVSKYIRLPYDDNFLTAIELIDYNPFLSLVNIGLSRSPVSRIKLSPRFIILDECGLQTKSPQGEIPYLRETRNTSDPMVDHFYTAEIWFDIGYGSVHYDITFIYDDPRDKRYMTDGHICI